MTNIITEPSDDIATIKLSSILWSLFGRFISFIFSIFIIKKFLNALKKNNPFPLAPGPKSLPFAGCIFQMLRSKRTYKWMLKFMDEMNTEIACFRLGRNYFIPVTSPELGCEFLKKKDSIFSSRPVCMSIELTSSDYLSTALSSSGEQQKKMKKIVVSSVISPAKHSWLHGKRIEEADNLVDYVNNQCKDSRNGGLINVRLAARLYCGNVVRKMFFNKRFFGRGRDDGGPGPEEVEHVEALFTILAHLFAFSVADYVPWMRSFDVDDHQKILRKAVASVRKYQDPEIQKRIETWQNGLQKEEEDLLDVLINLKDSNGRPLLTTEEIGAQIMDTVVGGYFIPKGSHVPLSRLGIGRNARIWEEPLEFKPKRHLKDMDEVKVDLSDEKLHIISFSRGKRGCQGVHLGSTMSIMLLARLLHSFTWEIPGGLSRID